MLLWLSSWVLDFQWKDVVLIEQSYVCMMDESSGVRFRLKPVLCSICFVSESRVPVSKVILSEISLLRYDCLMEYYMPWASSQTIQLIGYWYTGLVPSVWRDLVATMNLDWLFCLFRVRKKKRTNKTLFEICGALQPKTWCFCQWTHSWKTRLWHCLRLKAKCWKEERFSGTHI